MRKILTFIVVFFLAVINVNAASKCSYEEQRNIEQKAANVKVNYEIINVEKDDPMEEGYKIIYNYIKVSIYNVTEDLYVIVKNDKDNNEKMYSYTDAKDGIVTFDWEYLKDITNFTIQVYSSDKTNCSGESYKTFYLATPRFNEFSNIQICNDLSEFYLCQKYVTFDGISQEYFLEQLSSYQTGKINEQGEETVEPSLSDKIFEFINQYKWYIVGGLVVVLAGTYTIHTFSKKRVGK